MKKLSKRNILIILSIIFLIGLGLLLFKEYKNSHETENTLKISAIEKVLANSNSSTSKVKEIQNVIKNDSYIWYVIGFLGEAIFGSRMLVQWIASEKAKKNIVPELFWYLSLAGSVLVFVYVLHLQDPVLVISKGAGLLVYIRNVVLLKEDQNQN